jgi:hypothetical protein
MIEPGLYITEETYTRDPPDCGKCRVEHNVSPFHIGSDPKADCGKCIANSCLKLFPR